MARPVLPSAPPVDEGYGGSLSSSSGSRGSIRPHSVSPFLRSVRQKLEEEGEEDIDIEAIAYLLDFSTRERGACTPNQAITSQTVSSLKVAGPSGSSESSVMVRTFAVSPHNTGRCSPPRETSSDHLFTAAAFLPFMSCSEAHSIEKDCSTPGGSFGCPPRPRTLMTMRATGYPGNPRIPSHQRHYRDQVSNFKKNIFIYFIIDIFYMLLMIFLFF